MVYRMRDHFHQFVLKHIPWIIVSNKHFIRMLVIYIQILYLLFDRSGIPTVEGTHNQSKTGKA